MVLFDVNKIYINPLSFLFKSMDRNEVSNCPEMDYFMNESVSDVVFVVEGQRIPAMKSILSFKSKVFRTMFGGDFKESKDKEVLIEDTTYEAFRTFLQFLYCERLVLKDGNDFKMIEKICQLSDRYDVKKLLEKVDDHLMKIPLNCSDSVTFNWITKLAFDYKIPGIMAKVLVFIEENIKDFVKKDDKELHDLDVMTHNHFLGVLAKSYRGLNPEYYRNDKKIISFDYFSQQYQKINCSKCNDIIFLRKPCFYCPKCKPFTRY